MEHYATILNGPETLAADILANVARDRYIVRYVDEETRRDAGIDAVVGTHYTSDVDDAMRHANAWVTQQPVCSVELQDRCPADRAATDIPDCHGSTWHDGSCKHRGT